MAYAGPRGRGRPEEDKPLAWLHGEVRSPPLTRFARREFGLLLRRLQRGETLSLPHSRPMKGIGPRCHERRLSDGDRAWCLVYRIDTDAILILDVFAETTQATPRHILESCRRRLARYDTT